MKNHKVKLFAVIAFASVVMLSGCGAAETPGGQDPGDNGSQEQIEENNGQNQDQEQGNSEEPGNQNGEGSEESPEGNEGSDVSEGETGEDGAGAGEAEEGGNDEPAEDGELTAVSIIEKIQAEVELGTLMPLEAEQVKNGYGLDVAEFEDSAFMPSMFNISSVELTVIEMKSEDQFEDVKAGLEKHAESVIKTFETYLPQPYEQAKNYQIVQNGNYVLFSISADQEKIAEIFNDLFAAE